MSDKYKNISLAIRHQNLLSIINKESLKNFRSRFKISCGSVGDNFRFAIYVSNCWQSYSPYLLTYLFTVPPPTMPENRGVNTHFRF